MSYWTLVNTSFVQPGEDVNEYAKDVHTADLRNRGLEPAEDPRWSLTEGAAGWIEVRCATRQLRSDGERAFDEGRHRCIIESEIWGDEELPQVQCYEQDGKLWLVVYEHDARVVNFCPECGFSVKREWQDSDELLAEKYRW